MKLEDYAAVIVVAEIFFLLALCLCFPLWLYAKKEKSAKLFRNLMILFVVLLIIGAPFYYQVYGEVIVKETISDFS
ncbi:hypothetical protein [Paenibacillus sp. Marseille-Q4541]|uniref:hypothetical protein n=1 Tax=Paenibacillus sp. Marseille-Q4541 TaxID=2831522 RepID=UPI001BA9EED7|nr:hypothetical protein [Paenibacillus sp. Marseille-Q4541]